MDTLAFKIRKALFSNRREFEKVQGLILLFKYNDVSEWNAFDRLDSEMQQVQEHLISSLRDFSTSIFFDTGMSMKEKAWIRIGKIQKELIYNFYHEIFMVKDGGDFNGKQAKLEHLDQMATDLINKIEGKIKFYTENLEL